MTTSLRQVDRGRCKHTWKRGYPQIKNIQYIHINQKEHKHNTKENQTTKGKRKGQKKKYKLNRETRFKMTINTSLSIITLNVNEPNAPIKKYWMADWI